METSILFITSQDLTKSIRSGGALVAARNLRILRASMPLARVSICCMSDHVNEKRADMEVFKKEKGKIKKRVNQLRGYRIVTPCMEKSIIDKSNDYDIVVFDSTLFGKVEKRLIDSGYTGTIITFSHNNESDYARNMLRDGKWWRILDYYSSTLNERMAVECSTHLVCLNNRDSDSYMRDYGRRADLIIPVTLQGNGLEIPPVKQEEVFDLLFIGSLFEPNVDGLRWFVQEVMPHLNAELYVVGGGLETIRGDFASHGNVHIVGSVDSLTPYLSRARAVVSPIRYGTGMKTKTAEALQHGKRIFATAESLEGYDVEGCDTVTQCDTPEQFVEQINAFLGTNDFTTFFEDSRRLFEQRYSDEAYYGAIRKMILGVCEED